MLFNSLHFAWFFPLVVLVHFALPHRFRWMWLLGASYYFYMCWKPKYALLLLASTLLAYATALLIEKARTPGARRAWLCVSLAGNLGMLFFFKYFNFLNGSLRALFGHWGVANPVAALDVLLPVGISFFVFQSLSYSIDVYRGQLPAERNAGIFALYLSFFPHVMAGPIVRSTHLLPQFHRMVRFDPAAVSFGLKLMLWGLFKKVVIADRLALIIDPIYDNPAGHSGATLLLATYGFAFQIFCDFSGYTDIAIGAAKVMGFDFKKNFLRPYFAASVAEFWRRWHISLSTWFKDYLYLPLGGNRVGRGRWLVNIMIVFLASGIWHGANWTYLAWGGMHGMFLIAGEMTRGLQGRLASSLGLERFPGLRRFLGVAFTFHLVLFAWIFFRARSLPDAFFIVRTIAAGSGFRAGVPAMGVPLSALALAGLLILVLEAVHLLQARRGVLPTLARAPGALRWAVYLILLLCVLNLRPAHVVPFIYFQF